MTEQVKSNQLEMIDTDSDMIKHAKSELKFLRGDSTTEDEMQRLIEADILEMIKTFADQGAFRVFCRLLHTYHTQIAKTRAYHTTNR